jgi:hypothetical protein
MSSKTPADGDADQAEGQQDQPDQRIEHERDEGERPADDEKNAEEEKLDHGVLSKTRCEVGRVAPS